MRKRMRNIIYILTAVLWVAVVILLVIGLFAMIDVAAENCIEAFQK